MKRVVLSLFITTLGFASIVNDICYNRISVKGFCVGNNICAGGLNCKKVIHIRVNGKLEDVNIFYDESKLNGSYGNSCGVEPSGGCETKEDVKIGEFRLNKVTHFWFDTSIETNDSINIWVYNLISMSCIDPNNFYVSYKKNGKVYEGKLLECPVYKYFNAWDIGHDIDKSITTKIVNKQFSLKLVYRGRRSIQNIDVKYALIDLNSNNNISDWRTFYINTFSKIDNYKIDKAYKEVGVAFKVCSEYLGNGEYNLEPYNECSEECKDTALEPCWRYFYSSDKFAIRPEKFLVENLNKVVKAGEEFNITVKALDANGNPTKNYNEKVYVRGDSVDLEYNEAKNACKTGKLQIINKGEFKDGIANVSLKYSEVGKLDLSILEKDGSEFAKVDRDDTRYPFIDEALKISPFGFTVSFVPDHFDINYNVYNFKDGNFTYVSNNLKMSSTLQVNITAQNKERNVTKNYNEKCYAKDINLSVEYELSDNNKSINYLLTRLNSKDINFSVGDDINLSVDKSVFTTDNNGSANLTIYLNFDKNYTTPISEFNAKFTKVTVKDDDNIEGYKEDSKTSTFRYARIKVENVAGYGEDLNSTFKYMYWDKNDGWVVNKEHNASFGDIKDYYSKPSVTFKKGDILNGEEKVEFIAKRFPPYSAKVHFDIPSWLWYHPLAKEYKAPSSSNLDCLTHPCMKVNFMGGLENKGWAGIGNDNSRYSENNKTIHLQIKKEINATKREVKKLTW